MISHRINVLNLSFNLIEHKHQTFVRPWLMNWDTVLECLMTLPNHTQVRKIFFLILTNKHAPTSAESLTIL